MGMAAVPAAAAKKGKDAAKVVLFSIDPFVVNLSEPGRYLKVTMQFELAGEIEEKSVTEKVPILRDVIITLIGNQTYDYAASTEGKIQLKDEILLRTNRLFGKEVFRNLYFTDFVMQ
jgi:flagellar FliL protein